MRLVAPEGQPSRRVLVLPSSDSGSLFIGRGAATKIKDTFISRKHAEVAVRPSGHYELPPTVVLIALKSSPAVLLNDQVVSLNSEHEVEVCKMVLLQVLC